MTKTKPNRFHKGFMCVLYGVDFFSKLHSLEDTTKAVRSTIAIHEKECHEGSCRSKKEPDEFYE